ncbi:MAG: hypothetical protein AAF399_04360 [Bacteroidota bacterium]
MSFILRSVVMYVGSWFRRPYSEARLRLFLKTGGPLAQQALQALLLAHQDFIGKGQKRWNISEQIARKGYYLALTDVLDMARQNDPSLPGKRLSQHLFEQFRLRVTGYQRSGEWESEMMALRRLAPGLNAGNWMRLRRFLAPLSWGKARERFQQLRDTCQMILLLGWQGFSDDDLAAVVGYKKGRTVAARRKQALRQLSKDIWQESLRLIE